MMALSLASGLWTLACIHLFPHHLKTDYYQGAGESTAYAGRKSEIRTEGADNQPDHDTDREPGQDHPLRVGESHRHSGTEYEIMTKRGGDGHPSQP